MVVRACELLAEDQPFRSRPCALRALWPKKVAHRVGRVAVGGTWKWRRRARVGRGTPLPGVPWGHGSATPSVDDRSPVEDLASTDWTWNTQRHEVLCHSAGERFDRGRLKKERA